MVGGLRVDVQIDRVADGKGSKKLAVLGRFEGDAGRFQADRARVATIKSRTGMYRETFLCSLQEDFPWLKSDSTVRGAAEMVEEIKKEPKPKS